MKVRDLKLAIACDNETDKIKSLNKFLDDLFNSLTIFTKDDKPDLIFMEGNKFIMQQDLRNGYLWCRWDNFWELLEDEYDCSYEETQEIIQYKVDDFFKMGSLTPYQHLYHKLLIEEDFKLELLTPYIK